MTTTPDEAWSVSRLSGVLKRRVEEGFPAVWVRGEVVGVKRYPSGHWYFSLRDEGAKVDCTLWKSAALRLRHPIEEGSEVLALGQASVWEERTALRFNVSQVLPAAAVGAQAQAVERIRQALAADGLLDPARKREFPAFPRRIAVITSVAGAVVRDVITVARRRWPGVELLVINSAVQGATAPAELVAALEMVGSLSAVDCCIIGRGGGAKEDLAAFNDEALCRAIAACPVPVVSAVGHEVDVTLADLVADRRAATPSQAAEFILPERSVVERGRDQLSARLSRAALRQVSRRQERLQRTRDRLAHALTRQVRQAEQRLARVQARLGPALERRVVGPRQQLDRLGSRLEPLMVRQLDRARGRLRESAAKLHSLSPVAVLARGYAMVRDEQGTILREVAAFTPGQRIRLTVTDGEVPVRVESR